MAGIQVVSVTLWTFEQAELIKAGYLSQATLTFFPGLFAFGFAAQTELEWVLCNEAHGKPHSFIVQTELS